LFHPVELLEQWATQRNRPGLFPLNSSSFLCAWSTPGSGADPLTSVPALADAPDLLVVVTTYQRPHACAEVLRRLQRALHAQGLQGRAALLVLHDACGEDYREARQVAASISADSLWLDARQRLGKVRFWHTYQTAFLVARSWQPARTLFLHDDVEFDAHLLEEVEGMWRATEDDPQRRVLYLFSSSADEAEGRWIHFARRDLPQKRCRLTNWFDLQAFVVDRAFFELLDYRLVPIHPNRWKRKPSLSSGVGRQFTLRLQNRATVYQAWPPLVSHGAEGSIANREARSVDAFDNRADYALGLARRTAR
jgi:hypothetical protein